MSRQIKDIKDFNTGLLVYPRTHVSAVVGLENFSGGGNYLPTTGGTITGNVKVLGDLNINKISSEVGAYSLLFSNDLVYRDNVLDENLFTIKCSGNGTKFLADDGTYKTVSSGSGTITGVSANGTSIATSGVANIPAASTSAYGVTKLSSSTSSTSTTLAATASAVKSAYDLANGKQAKLVSGTNIKTINGESILGSGNIVISGGTSDIPVLTTTASSLALTPNVYYKWTNTPTSLTITLETPSNTNILNNYMFEFSTGSNGCTLSLPSSIKWLNGSAPTIWENKTYLISIINNLALVAQFS